MSVELKGICFYNYFGNGDVFNTREFAKEMMEFYPNTNFYFAHSKNSRMFQDIPELRHAKIHEFMRGDRHFVFGNEGDLYINTWIGLNGKYVGPGIACTIDRHQKLWNDLMEMIGLEIRFKKNFLEYIPIIDFKKLMPIYINRIEKFVDKHRHLRKVLICNGNVQSNQAKNFDFVPVIKLLINRFPNIVFITTEKVNYKSKNLFFTGDIIQMPDGFDLNEISYLSRFTDTIVGRSSGPFSFTQTAQNYADSFKYFLSFSYHKEGGHLVTKGETKAKRIWSGETSTEAVSNEIGRILRR
jgi:hypothetical protein